MSAYWMVVVTESSEAGNRDVFHMVVQTDKPEGPSESESFDAGKHFGVRPREGCQYTLRGGAFHPDKKCMTKMSTLSAFACGNSSFWDFRCIT